MTFAVLIENIVSMNAAQSETPFGSKVRKGMFRTVSQLYKVTEFLPCIKNFHSDILYPFVASLYHHPLLLCISRNNLLNS